MFIPFCVYVLVCLLGIRFYFGSEGNREYLSVEQTQAVKGLFILLVFFSHIQGYVTVTDRKDLLCGWLIGIVGQGMVTLFMFYSGYGIMESVCKKGDGYVSTMPVKRIFSTWFRFACAVTLFVAVALWNGQELTLSRIGLAYIGWESLGNSNWYIFAVLVLYTITYLAFRLTGTKHLLRSNIVVLLGSVMYISLLSFRGIKGMWWYDTVLCYGFGMAWSLFIRTPGERYLWKWIPWGIALIGSMGVFCWVTISDWTAINQIIRNLAFAVAIVLLTMRISFRNKILRWCGKHLFPLYILQRIPMIIFSDLGIQEYSFGVYIVLCLVVTLLMVYPFEWVTDWLWKKVETCFKV